VVLRPEDDLPDGFVSFDDLGGGDGTSPDGYARDVCLLLYTSGTTADPKGVLHNHETLVYECRSIVELFGLTSSDGVFMASPLTHITGVLYALVLPALTGAGTTLLDIWDPVVAADLVERERCRFTVGATPFLQGLTDVYEARGARSALRAFACGGADVPPDLVRRARRVLGTAVVRVYGSTEMPTLTCGHPDDPEHIAADTDGRTIGPVELRLLDEHDGVGELAVRGPELFLGYLDPALNDDAFFDDGFFATGDLASFDSEGAVTIRGRKKDIIIRGGENIAAKEVEDLLYGHPDVQEVVVVAMPDQKLGEKVCAFGVPAPGAGPDVTTFRVYLEKHRIARQKFPERVELVSELPKTASGKIQKFVLRERIRATVERETRGG
jgi:cyclohexanecarboxylate-CoA ligase